MSASPQESPQKVQNLSPVVATPSGGRIFNPFQEGFIDKLGHIAVTPGIFGQLQTPAVKSLSNTTPSKERVSFFWSPEVQGDYFPTEIDENPLLQLKLQEIYDADNDDIAQRKISSFFESHLIAPSPDAIPAASSMRGSRNSPTRLGLPRTSSLIPTGTPKGKSNARPESSAIMMTDVTVQTAISISPETDLVALLQKAIRFGENSGEVDVNVTSLHHPNKEITFCEASAEETVKPYPHNSLFLCLACQKAHSINCYRRRSLFVEALDTIDDLPSTISENSSHFASIPFEKATCFNGSAVSKSKFEEVEINLSPKSDEDITEEGASLHLGLPASWATESVCQQASPRNDSFSAASGVPFMDCSFSKTPKMDQQNDYRSMELGEFFGRADLTPIMNISSRSSSRFKQSRTFDFNSVSPVAAGRTSPEARAIRHQSMGSTLDDSGEFSEFQTVLEDSFDASFPPKQHILVSPQLSPILPSSPELNNCPVQQYGNFRCLFSSDSQPKSPVPTSDGDLTNPFMDAL